MATIHFLSGYPKDLVKDAKLIKQAGVKCTDKCKELMKKTFNPFKRYSLKRDAQRFMNHVFGINLAIRRFKKTWETD